MAAAIGAAAAGALVALHYHRLGLTLSHYDARGHLVVARRIFDSITPGWQQIGAVWLPLPPPLNAVPGQGDADARTAAARTDAARRRDADRMGGPDGRRYERRHRCCERRRKHS